MLFQIERGDNSDDLESFIRYYRNRLLQNRSFALLDEVGEEAALRIRFAILNEVSEVFQERRKIEYLCEDGITMIHRAINAVVPQIVQDMKGGADWTEIEQTYLEELCERLVL